MNIKRLLPFILFISIIVLFWRGLGLHPNEIPSPLMNETVPQFHLPLLFNPAHSLSNQDFYGHITLLNIWATWCSVCAEEQDFLLQIAKQNDFYLYGLNYKDDPAQAKKWLAHYGNPYRLIGIDETGQVAIDWGVYGTPETFIIDQKGIIRYKHVGALTSNNWETELLPIIKKLQMEAK